MEEIYKKLVQEYNILWIGESGSTALGLSDEKSDIDYFAFYIPTTKDIFFGNTKIIKIKYNNKIEIKLVPITKIDNYMYKSSIEFLKCLFTAYTENEVGNKILKLTKAYLQKDYINFRIKYKSFYTIKTKIKKMNNEKFGSLKDFQSGNINFKLYANIFLSDYFLSLENPFEILSKQAEIPKSIKETYFDIRKGKISKELQERLDDNSNKVLEKIDVKYNEEFIEEYFNKLFEVFKEVNNYGYSCLFNL